MNKISLLFIGLIASVSVSMAQNNSASPKKVGSDDIYTSLRPADGQGAVFNTKEELDAKVQDKKDKMISMIKANAADTAAVRQLRYELWRFENAIVAPKK